MNFFRSYRVALCNSRKKFAFLSFDSISCRLIVFLSPVLSAVSTHSGDSYRRFYRRTAFWYLASRSITSVLSVRIALLVFHAKWRDKRSCLRLHLMTTCAVISRVKTSIAAVKVAIHQWRKLQCTRLQWRRRQRDSSRVSGVSEMRTFSLVFMFVASGDQRKWKLETKILLNSAPKSPAKDQNKTLGVAKKRETWLMREKSKQRWMQFNLRAWQREQDEEEQEMGFRSSKS